MEIEFINRVVKVNCWLAVLSFLPIYFFFSLSDALGIFLGATWSSLNLLFIKHLLQNLFLVSPKNYLKILLILIVKFPLLYSLGYYLSLTMAVPVTALLIGFTSIFFVAFFNSLKNMLGKSAVILIPFLLLTTNLQASIEGDVPEVPNFITLLNKWFQDVPWIAFLHHWDTIFFSILMAVTIAIAFYLGANKKDLIPSGWQNFVEWFGENFRYFILEVLGPKGEKYIPLLGTLFIYILCMNWLALIPFMKAPTSSIDITVALAICVFVLVQYLNIKNWGFFGFLYHMAGSPKDVMGWLLVPLMFPIEILTQFTRPITLSLRLFGNVVGEDILIGAGALFGVYLFASYDIIGGVPMQLPFMFLALLTGLMQALVFTLLSTIYILLSMPSLEYKH